MIATYLNYPIGNWDYISAGDVLNVSVLQKATEIVKASSAGLDILKNFYLVFLASQVGPNQKILGPKIATIRRTSSNKSVKLDIATRPFAMTSNLRVYNIFLISDIDIFVASMLGSSMVLSNGEHHTLNVEFPLV